MSGESVGALSVFRTTTEVMLRDGVLTREEKRLIIKLANALGLSADEPAEIYAAIRELFATTNPVDIITVTNYLRTQGELEASGGPSYISQLTSRVASSANIEFHSRIIAEKHIKRELIRMSSEVMEDAYDDTQDVFDVLSKEAYDLFSDKWRPYLLLSNSWSSDSISTFILSRRVFSELILSTLSQND